MHFLWTIHTSATTLKPERCKKQLHNIKNSLVFSLFNSVSLPSIAILLHIHTPYAMLLVSAPLCKKEQAASQKEKKKKQTADRSAILVVVVVLVLVRHLMHHRPGCSIARSGDEPFRRERNCYAKIRNGTASEWAVQEASAKNISLHATPCVCVIACRHATRDGFARHTQPHKHTPVPVSAFSSLLKPQ